MLRALSRRQGFALLAASALVAVACSGTSATNTSDGGADGSPGTDASSSSGGSSTSSSSTSSSSTTSASSTSTSGFPTTIKCDTHTVEQSGTVQACNLKDSVACGTVGSVYDQYEVVCHCQPNNHTCDCNFNNALINQVPSVACPSCNDPSIMQSAFKRCGFPY